MVPPHVNVRSTRSGHTYAVWDAILPANPDFSFDSALLRSIQEEPEDYHDIFSLSPLSTPPTSRPASPSPLSTPPTSRPASPSPRSIFPSSALPSSSKSTLSSRTPSPDHALPLQTASTTDKASSSKKRPSKRRKDKNNSRKRRKVSRSDEAKTLVGNVARAKAREKYVSNSAAVKTNLLFEKLPVASTGFTGLKSTASPKIVVLKELCGPGANLKLVTIRSNRPRPIIDEKGRVVALWAGQPADSTWNVDMARICALLEHARLHGKFSHKNTDHGRGKYAFLAAGYAHGGGRQVPCNLNRPTSKNYQLVCEMLQEPAFERLAKFISSVFVHWAPRLYQYYMDNMNAVCSSPYDIRRLWSGSIFAASVFNLGPQTVTYRHKDHGNIPFGWCSVTALGSYDFTRGGHIILWDLGIIVEFPPGSSFLLPSAAFEHSNADIASHETRYSITQYTAGALFRWIEHGMKGNREFEGGLSEEDLKTMRAENATRWKFGLSLFSTLSELQEMVDK